LIPAKNRTKTNVLGLRFERQGGAFTFIQAKKQNKLERQQLFENQDFNGKECYFFSSKVEKTGMKCSSVSPTSASGATGAPGEPPVFQD
jgi:hypothetical protein